MSPYDGHSRQCVQVNIPWGVGINCALVLCWTSSIHSLFLVLIQVLSHLSYMSIPYPQERWHHYSLSLAQSALIISIPCVSFTHILLDPIDPDLNEWMILG